MTAIIVVCTYYLTGVGSDSGGGDCGCCGSSGGLCCPLLWLWLVEGG